jgi:hypothetical protein
VDCRWCSQPKGRRGWLMTKRRGGAGLEADDSDGPHEKEKYPWWERVHDQIDINCCLKAVVSSDVCCNKMM